MLCLRGGGEEVLLEHNAELFPDALQLLEVLGVLALVLDLCVDACAGVLVLDPVCALVSLRGLRACREKRTLEYPDGSREVVDAPGGSEGSDDNAGRGDKIVGESVVQVTLQLEDVLHVLELLLVSARERTRVSKWLTQAFPNPSLPLPWFLEALMTMHMTSEVIEQVYARSPRLLFFISTSSSNVHP
jgi:hypothetical protein